MKLVHFPCFAVLLTAICNYNFQNIFHVTTQSIKLKFSFSYNKYLFRHLNLMKKSIFLRGHNQIMNRFQISDCKINQSLDAKLDSLFNEPLSISILIALILDEWWNGTDLLLLAYNRKIVKMRFNLKYASSLFIKTVLFLLCLVNKLS